MLCLVAALVVGLGHPAARAATTKVTAEGRAAGDTPNARAMALTDALREAVRLGAGVDVLSTTGVKDFVLQFDRVFETAFGYVRNYVILESGLGADEIYRVKISAKVGEGTPDRQDVLALKQIVSLKKSPRVAIRVDEIIEGVPTGSGLAAGWFEEQAKAMQLQLIDLGQAGFQNDKMAARDELVGDQKSAAFRKADIPQNVDFLIDVKVRASHGGQELVYGTALNKFSINADLRAVKADTGVVIASVAIPSWEGLSQIATLDGAARDLVHRLLAGDTGVADAPGAWALFRNILAHWVSELDLGAIYKIDFKGIEDTEFEAVQTALKANDHITSVWDREFDSAGLSTIEAESRLEAQDLKKAVLAALGGSFKFDRGTAHALQFIRAASPDLTPAPVPGHLPPSARTSSIPLVTWLGLGAALLAAAAFLLLRGRKPAKHPEPAKPRTEIESHDVFVSYAHDDEQRILPILEQLRASGIQTWRDAEAIRPGKQYDEVIAQAIMGCRLFVVFISHASTKSSFVNDEVNFALNEKKTIIPLLIDPDVQLPPRLRLRMGMIQNLTLTADNQQAIAQSIFDELRQHGVHLDGA
jgi:hypothetical protein